ncbi:helix-turn-helix domain-containing protein [Tamlana sp. 2201CG12-4]|uniref:helix-turn-helix domain-containing protein n=1 Tax=Tamlana sp. 2201CG12-4 TaxID=3112582 RepID=UPI002DBA0E82|nr:helix-turn-helix domain-containing protein [Tamlana sp. 2201CG12-4]MEC3906397.1 helix-turn-helix domain-containing protein [Tamlana sp. 2201CG12-4]
MKLKTHIINPFLLIPLVILLAGCHKNTTQNHFSENVKVALRDVGNRLLLINKDSSSLILPITKLNENSYKITFENTLSITPDSLVNVISHSLKNADLPKRYIVEVINCHSETVSYSFKITGLTEQNIVPCSGRNLPNACYTIHVLFLDTLSFWSANKYYLLLIVLLIITGLSFMYRKQKQKTLNQTGLPFSKIGSYRFYKDQNKLIKDSVEIKLSTKECELMAILSAHQNQVVKRDTLVKEIWEDHGVFVDRSLDTFISKLRKKFKDDTSINIINIHGVGYKLEVH